MDIADFLYARFDERERIALAFIEGRNRLYFYERDGGQHPDAWAFDDGPGNPLDVLADVEAGRAIVELHIEAYAAKGLAYDAVADYLDCVLRLLALRFADHSDFQEEWRD